MAYVIHIDDNEIDRLILTRSLKKHFQGIEVKSVGSVALAEEYLSKIGEPGFKTPDLIITDNNMPEKSGFEFVEAIKSSDKLRQIPIIMLSSSNLEKDVRKAINLGVESYLSKPLNPTSIQHFIKFIKDRE